MYILCNVFWEAELWVLVWDSDSLCVFWVAAQVTIVLFAALPADQCFECCSHSSLHSPQPEAPPTLGLLEVSSVKVLPLHCCLVLLWEDLLTFF